MKNEQSRTRIEIRIHPEEREDVGTLLGRGDVWHDEGRIMLICK
jgi:hypothetical protein